MILSNLRCNGDEESLNNCTHDGVGRHSCFSSETASVVCSNSKFYHISYFCRVNYCRRTCTVTAKVFGLCVCVHYAP